MNKLISDSCSLLKQKFLVYLREDLHVKENKRECISPNIAWLTSFSWKLVSAANWLNEFTLADILLKRFTTRRGKDLGNFWVCWEKRKEKGSSLILWHDLFNISCLTWKSIERLLFVKNSIFQNREDSSIWWREREKRERE